jgi:hypothetical protein
MSIKEHLYIFNSEKINIKIHLKVAFMDKKKLLLIFIKKDYYQMKIYILIFYFMLNSIFIKYYDQINIFSFD